MLSSITPLGERGRHRRYWPTVGCFGLGCLLGAGAVGAGLGVVGQTLVGGPGSAAVGVLALSLGAGLALELWSGRSPLPGPHRQVNEDWLHVYRGWVYGLGYGAQLGCGLATRVSSGAFYAAVLAALLSASPGAGAVILGCFGAVRALTLLGARGVRQPQDLLAFHRRLIRWQEPARGLGLALQALLALGALVEVVA